MRLIILITLLLFHSCSSLNWRGLTSIEEEAELIYKNLSIEDFNNTLKELIGEHDPRVFFQDVKQNLNKEFLKKCATKKECITSLAAFKNLTDLEYKVILRKTKRTGIFANEIGDLFYKSLSFIKSVTDAEVPELPFRNPRNPIISKEEIYLIGQIRKWFLAHDVYEGNSLKELIPAAYLDEFKEKFINVINETDINKITIDKIKLISYLGKEEIENLRKMLFDKPVVKSKALNISKAAALAYEHRLRIDDPKETIFERIPGKINVKALDESMFLVRINRNIFFVDKNTSYAIQTYQNRRSYENTFQSTERYVFHDNLNFDKIEEFSEFYFKGEDEITLYRGGGKDAIASFLEGDAGQSSDLIDGKKVFFLTPNKEYASMYSLFLQENDMFTTVLDKNKNVISVAATPNRPDPTLIELKVNKKQFKKMIDKGLIKLSIFPSWTADNAKYYLEVLMLEDEEITKLIKNSEAKYMDDIKPPKINLELRRYLSGVFKDWDLTLDVGKIKKNDCNTLINQF